jgi:hypothetical protein
MTEYSNKYLGQKKKYHEPTYPKLVDTLNGLRKGMTYTFPAKDWKLSRHPSMRIQRWLPKKRFHTRKVGEDYHVTRI